MPAPINRFMTAPCWIGDQMTRSNLARFRGGGNDESRPASNGPAGARITRSPSPAVPLTMMVMMVVPAMPAVMTMETMVVVMASPMNFRRLRPGVLLDRGRGAGIAERQRAGPLGRSGESEQRANSRKSQNFHYLHVQSPRVAGMSGPRRMARNQPNRIAATRSHADARDLNRV